MPHYTFALRDGSDLISDEEGATLAGERDAFEYACDVALELMRGREKQTRIWRLLVYGGDNKLVFEIPFAALDGTLNHLSSELRQLIESFCSRQLALKEAVHAARATVRESRALVALSRGKPYLATRFGEHVIR